MAEQHREYCRRAHRVLGQYLSIEAWLRGVDCLVLERPDLEAYLGLARFKGARVKWLQDDLKPWFPCQVPFYASSSAASLHSLFLSRIPIEKHLAGGAMSTAHRIAQMREGAPLTQLFSQNARLPSEEAIVGYLAQLSSGLIVPKRRKRARRKSR